MYILYVSFCQMQLWCLNNELVGAVNVNLNIKKLLFLLFLLKGISFLAAAGQKQKECDWVNMALFFFLSSYLIALFIYLSSLPLRFNQNTAATVLGTGALCCTQGPRQMV